MACLLVQLRSPQSDPWIGTTLLEHSLHLRTTTSPKKVERYAYLAAYVRSMPGSRFMSTLHIIRWINFFRYKLTCTRDALPAGSSEMGLRCLAQA